MTSRYIAAVSIPDLAKAKIDIEARLKALEATFDQLVEVLIGRGVLAEGHRRLLSKTAERAKIEKRSRVLLRAYSGDKYAIEGPEIDCASLLHLCRARCCTLRPRMTRQDLEEGLIEWEIEDPYVVRRADDAYCFYVEDSGGCGCYENRPASCREFDCRDDPRIWTDFENKIPAPYALVRSFPPPE